MKNVIKHSKKVFLMVALFATVMGYAKEPSFYISTNEDDRTTLTLAYVKEGNLFTIKDENGLILYKESIQQSGTYTKGFDLTALPDGAYFFELDKDVEITTIPFSVKSNLVTFDKEMAETIFKPTTSVKDDLVLVSQLSLNEAPFTVEIYFEGNGFGASDELVFSETIENTQTIKRVYKLTGLTNGSYKIVYKTEGKEFVEYI